MYYDALSYLIISRSILIFETTESKYSIDRMSASEFSDWSNNDLMYLIQIWGSSSKMNILSCQRWKSWSKTKNQITWFSMKKLLK